MYSKLSPSPSPRPARSAGVSPASKERAGETPAVPAGLHTEFLAEIKATDVRVIHDVLGVALHQDLARKDDVGAISQAERLAYIVVGNQHADATLCQMTDQGLYVPDGNRINSGERLAEQHIIRPRGERTGTLDAPSFAARQRTRLCLAHTGDIELLQQAVQFGFAPALARLDHFENGANVPLHIHPSEN